MSEKSNEIRKTSNVPLRSDDDQEPITTVSHPLPTVASTIKTTTFQRMTSWSSLMKPPSLSKQISTKSTRSTASAPISPSKLIQRQFIELLNEPISEQHKRYFRKYFAGDISSKTFTIEEFSRLFHLTPTLSKRLLIILDLRQSFENGSISGENVIRIACLLWISPMSVKAFILFKLFDEDNNGFVAKDEIRAFYRNYLSETKIIKNQTKFDEIIETFLRGFFSRSHENQQEYKEINFDDFYRTLQQNPSVFNSLYLISLPDQGDENDEETIWYQRWWSYLKNNAPRIGFLILYILVSIALIIYVVVYRTVVLEHSVWQVFARIGGMLVNFNFALAITLMLKQTMTIIRRIYFIRLFVPVDEHIDAHRVVGTMLFISSMIHSLAYVIQFATHLDGHSWFALMFTTAAQIGWVSKSATITGDILFVFLIIMFVFALQCVRERSGFYQLFSYTHLLIWPVFILLVIHEPNFWKWGVGPMSLLVVEKVYLLIKRYLSKYGRTRLISVRIEDENALSLIFKRPNNFQFHVGEYINICLPHIVSYEWHPFSISSSPERKDILRVTIRKQKNWTRKVHEHFSAKLKKNLDDLGLTVIVTDPSNKPPPNIMRRLSLVPKEIHFDDNERDAEIYVEGPFSSCTSYIFDCEHVVLIGGGIGITPYISALESLINRLREQRCVCFCCGSVNYNENRFTGHKLKKVDFIWINGDFANFSWFLNILDEFEAEQEAYLNSTSVNPEEQRSRYLDIHLYCTSIPRSDRTMLGNVPYKIFANIYDRRTKKDILTRLKTSTCFGRPQWKTLFAKFKAEKRSTHVFFTGAKTIGDDIKKYCNRYRFKYSHEPFF